MAEAMAMAVRSLPPRPSVVTRPSGVFPWKPATMTIAPSFRYFCTWRGVILAIFALVWNPSVMMPACAPVSDTAFLPSA